MKLEPRKQAQTLPDPDQLRWRPRPAATIQRVRIDTSRLHPSPMAQERPPGAGAGRMSVTPKASTDAPGRSAATEDEKLLERRPTPDFLDTDPWRALRILSEFVDGFDAMAEVGPAVTVFGSARTQAPTTRCTTARGRSARTLAEAGLRGHHRRRAGHDGGGQPRLSGGWRAVGRLQHRAAARAGAQRLRRPRASSSATSSPARRCS